jgi:hypothetical protein
MRKLSQNSALSTFSLVMVIVTGLLLTTFVFSFTKTKQIESYPSNCSQTQSNDVNIEDILAPLTVQTPVQILKFWKNGKPTTTVPSYQDLLNTFHNRVSPYEAFDNPFNRAPSTEFTFTNIKSEDLITLFSNLQPKFIIEVGSFIGGSAIQMSKALKKINLHSSSILCIGTVSSS